MVTFPARPIWSAKDAAASSSGNSSTATASQDPIVRWNERIRPPRLLASRLAPASRRGESLTSRMPCAVNLDNTMYVAMTVLPVVPRVARTAS